MIQAFLLSAAISASCLAAGKNLLHYFQLESYQFPGYFRTIRRNMLKAFLPGAGMTILIAGTLAALSFLFPGANRSPGLAWLFLGVEIIFLNTGGCFLGKSLSEKKAKKAFVITPRIKRLYAVSWITMTLILLPLALSLTRNDGSGQILPAHLIILFPVLLPLWVALSGLIAWPVEKGISELYFRDAQHILSERPDLIRIGITGSWGKTSVKYILGTILEEKYHTLITPASYNTPMGVTKVIRTSLEPGHRVFVAEMGARHVGDIKEMCRLVHPGIGVLTSVGPQHLDTFRTLDRIRKTKYELMEAIPDEGLCFFADDNGICRELYDITNKDKMIAGMDPIRDDVYADNIHYSSEGSSFMLHLDNQTILCCTKLLGELNIKNILISSAVAYRLGLSPEEISRGISRIRPVEHRLQLVQNPGGISVIDDAFNSNILGAKQAFQVLKEFPGKRIVITPGMVELGDREYELNREFGASMAPCCDIAILIGRKRSESIHEGLLSAGFKADSVYICSSLDEATKLMTNMVSSGDTVLFENDLPDHYSE